jgi:hypothetical protein
MPFSGIFEEKRLRKLVKQCASDDLKVRRAAFVELQPAYTNNAFVSDLLKIDGCVEIFMKAAAEEPYAGQSKSESPATCFLGRMGFEEYDPSREENRDKDYFEKYGRPDCVDEKGRTIMSKVPRNPGQAVPPPENYYKRGYPEENQYPDWAVKMGYPQERPYNPSEIPEDESKFAHAFGGPEIERPGGPTSQ